MALSFFIKDGDWVLDESVGRPLTVSGLAKTRQDFGELLSIETQKNGFGANIVSLVGEVPESPDSVAFEVMRSISAAVERWIGLQQRQRIVLAKNETVSRLVFNQARVDETDPTSVMFRASIFTKSGDELARSGLISALGVVQ
jgi:hypothetical protein